MDYAWIVTGCLILLVTFLDTFLAVLNYDESGILVNRIMRGQWVILRSFTRRVSRRRRPLVLRQVTGVLILTTILTWIGGVVLGFTFIYLGLIGLGQFQLSKGMDADFVGALYLSLGQFSTVGAENVSPAGGWINVVPVLEALSSVVLLSFIIAFLSNVYSVIQSLRSLCADFFSTGPGVGSPIEALQPFFPDGRPRDIDRHLNGLIDDFNLYCDGLRQDHSAYHFQSGDDKFSLPFALAMTSGVVGALRWGLPTGHDASKSPSLVRLTEAFDDFRERRYRMMRWATPSAPTPLTRAQFGAEYQSFHASTGRGALEPWALRFFVLNDAMAETIRASGPVDLDDAYLRYVAWLPFAHHAQQFTADVGRDLDYQPIYRGIAETPDVAPSSTTQPSVGSSADAGIHTGRPARARRGGGVAAWLRRRHLFLDPGSVRLWTALRTLAAVTAAVAVAVPLSAVVGVGPVTAGVFAGLIALFAAPSSSGWGSGLMRRVGILAVVPVTFGIVIGTFLPRDPVLSTIGLAVIAAAAVWLGRFGPRWASFGQLAFMAFYFALLLAVGAGELLGVLVSAAIGVLCTWISSLLPHPSTRRQIHGGIEAITERSAVLLDSAIDVVSATGGNGMTRVLRAELSALRRSAVALTGLLGPDSRPEGLSDARVRTLRLQVFDVQLAAENLASSLPQPTDYAVTVDQRAILAGELVALQGRVRAPRDAEPAARSTAVGSAAEKTVAPDGWPAEARHVHAAIRELSSALVGLLATAIADEHAPVERFERFELSEQPGHPKPSALTSVSVPAAGSPLRRESGRGRGADVDRRAVQAGVSTGLALLFGGLVSTSSQYWVAMPAFQTLSGSDGETRVRSVQRIVGTVAGAAAAFGLALCTGHDLLVAIPVLALSVFLMSFLRSVASSWTSFWQTVLLATMYDVLSTLDAEAIGVRILETIIGAVVAVLVSAVVLPTRTRKRILQAMSNVVFTSMSVTHAALQRLQNQGAAPSAEQAAEATSTMNRQDLQIQALSEPLRHNPGALQHDGIESQLTSLSALLYYTRHLVKNADAVSSATMLPAEWLQLDGATSDNFASTLAALDGRLPTRVHDLKDVATTTAPGAGEAERQALLDVERINQTLLAYMAAVKPGSTSDASANRH